MRIKFTLFLSLFLLCATWSQEGKASHILGGDISYSCVNNCTLQVELRAFRDCSGASVISPNPLNFVAQTAGCGQPTALAPWPLEVVTELSPMCSSYSLTQCQDPQSIHIGVEEFYYERDYEICSVPNCSYVIEWSTCCRTPAITSLVNAGSSSIFLGSTTMNTSQPCNNSPAFTSMQPPFVCTGQPTQFSMAATDPDGDSLTYSFGPCFDNATTQVNYAPGYSVAQPLGPGWVASLDPTTGVIGLMPNPGPAEIGVICVYVDEYRNGVLIGQTVRDYTIIAKACPPALCGDNLVMGTVYKEENANCVQDPTEISLAHRQLLILPDSVVIATDSAGDYRFTPKPGSYTIEPLPVNPLWQYTCPPAGVHVAAFTGSNDTISGLDFGSEATVDCPLLWVDVGSNIVRPCFATTWNIDYCNNGTDSAYNAFVEFTIDTNYSIVSTSIPFTSSSGGTYTFPVGNLGINQCGSFQVVADLACDTALTGQVFCAEAHIFPDSSCLPADPTWDKSSVSVSGVCTNDTACFTVTNTGSASNGNMQGPTNWRLYINAQLSLNGTLQLCGGCDTTLCFPGNGQDYRFEVDQRPGHPGNSQPNATLQGCGSGASAGNFVLNLPLNDGDDFIAVDCRTAVNSYDPNMKYVIPRGVKAPFYYIDSTDNLEYTIDFQNTGTANAIRVILRDTLSKKLDITSIVPGASSHPYTWRINAERELEFTFNNIQLVPESVDPVASIGYVKYKINQVKGNQKDAKIENLADIYFDFNSPIRTNTVVNTIGWPIRTAVDFTPEPLDVSIYPNPTTGEFFAQVNSLPAGTPLQLDVYSMVGQKVTHLDFEAGTKYQISLKNLPQGIYIYRISDRTQMLRAGKIILE